MKDRLKKGQRAAGIATIVTIFLSLAKAIAGFLSGSILLIADGVHSGVDIIAIFASWFGLKISQRKANKKFPYGYYKAENLATLVVVGFIFLAAYEIFIGSYGKLFTVTELRLPAIALAVPLFSSALSYAIAHYEHKVGREIGSQSLIANAQESKADILSSLAVFAGVLLSYFHIRYIEGIIGMLLSLLIVKIGIQNARSAVLSLMDASPDLELEKKIEKLVMETPGAREVSHIRLRQSGLFVFGEASILVSRSLDVNRAHGISEIIEAEIKKNFPTIESFLIHIEPHRGQKQKVLIPIKDKKGLDSTVVGHFGRADYFLYVMLNDGKTESWSIKTNPHVKKEVRAGLSAAKLALSEKIDAVVLQRIGEIAFHTLRDGYVDMYRTDGKTARQVIGNLMDKKLYRLDKPTHASEK